jgi:hypothetical protein
MTLVGSAAAAATLELPTLWGIGRYAVGDTSVQFPIDRSDLERDTAWATDVLAEYGVRRGRRVHVISGGWESPWYAPFFAAARRLDATYTCADIFGFDARRTDLFLRRLTPHVVIGLPVEVVAGLADSDALGNLRPVPHVLARPDAAADLAAAGIEAGVFACVGPATAITRSGGTGLSYNTAEWRIDAPSGELLVTAVAERADRVSSAPTGVRGEVVQDGVLRLTG